MKSNLVHIFINEQGGGISVYIHVPGLCSITSTLCSMSSVEDGGDDVCWVIDHHVPLRRRTTVEQRNRTVQTTSRDFEDLSVDSKKKSQIILVLSDHQTSHTKKGEAESLFEDE